MKRDKGSVLIGLILILLGGLWLLNNLNIFHFELKFVIIALRKLWPLILIIIGLNLIITNKFLNKLFWIIFLLTLILFGYRIQQNKPIFDPNIFDIEGLKIYSVPLHNGMMCNLDEVIKDLQN